MSYCRWSDDDWQCDVYCYEDVNGGWTTHVAGNRAEGVPKLRTDVEPWSDEWVASYNEQLAYLDKADRIMITQPYAGETFNDPTLEAFRARLTQLWRLGYHIPMYVFDQIAEELDEDGPPEAA